MALLRNSIIRRSVLSIVLLWSIVSFWFFSPNLVSFILITIFSVLTLVFIWIEKFAAFILIFISFTSAFALYGFLFFFNLSLWIIMIAVLIVFSYLFSYADQRLKLLGSENVIYLLIFGLIILELFLFLSYYLVSPLNRSLIIAATSYLLIGFASDYLTVEDKGKFVSYIAIFSFLILIVFLSANWGG